MTKKLYYGDNLQILREHIADESVDLIYLDPPFNYKSDYNLLFNPFLRLRHRARRGAKTETQLNWHRHHPPRGVADRKAFEEPLSRTTVWTRRAKKARSC
ncbi:MAG: hypothetical protein LH481_03525 [Burkholderiales bacterium]|nr:hypothetical protein [Burkholderiales bacterium]